MSKILLPLIVITFFLPLAGRGQGYYWVSFKDKAGNGFSVAQPETYLSPRAIQRRANQNIPIDEKDLPVSQAYIQQVETLGADFIHASKWMNGATFISDSANFTEKALLLPFVSGVELTKPSSKQKSAVFNKFFAEDTLTIDSSYYGNSVSQIAQVNGHYLHNKNFKGQGMIIAVLDAGFYKANEYAAFDSLWQKEQILGTRDFVNPASDIFAQHYHGMSVLSIIGGNIPGQLIGSAPEASFWLLRSEDANSEYLIEEDNWIVAAEFADSAGVDVINSSLGYSVFTDTLMNHTYSQLDGNTTRVARGADIAASRGMLVCISAGNEGNKLWRYITSPADADSVLTIAAVNTDGLPASFSSVGPAADGDIKPNVGARGQGTVLFKYDGTVSSGNGTSYSSPLIAGLAACLWQANPSATAWQIKSAIEESASLFSNPDTLLGYGIPDFRKAGLILKGSEAQEPGLKKGYLVFPNPFSGNLVIQNFNNISGGTINIRIFDINGKTVFRQNTSARTQIPLGNLSDLPEGLLFLQLVSETESVNFKIFKTK